MSRVAPPAAGAILPTISDDREPQSFRITLSRRAAGILGGWWIFLGALDAVWLARDTRPPHWDAAIHLLSSLRYRRAITGFLDGRAGLSNTIQGLFSVDAFYPPFAPFAGALLTLGFRPSAALSTWVLNQFFLAILMFGTFRLGRRIGDTRSGIAAAIAVTTFGGILGASHGFMLDLPLAAWTVLSLDALMATEGFARTGRSLLFGALCGLGMLTKWTFLFFLAGPIAAELVSLRRFPDRLVRLRNAAAGSLASLAVALPWYLVHAPNLAQDFLGFGGFSREDWRRFPPVWSLQSLAFYPRSLAELLLLPWALALAIAIVLCWRGSPGVRRLVLLSLPGLVFLTLLRAKDVRYALPLLPVAAVIATAWVVDSAPRPRLRTAAAAALSSSALLMAILRHPPLRQDWKVTEALASIPEPSSGPPACVRVVPDLPQFHRFAFEYAAEAAGRNVEIVGVGRLPWFTDAVIVKTGDQGARPGPAQTMAAICRRDGDFHQLFRKAWDGPLPDGSRAEVYVRDVQAIAGIAPGELIESLRRAVRREVERNTHAEFSGRIEIEPESDAGTLGGRFRSIRISAENLPVGGTSPGEPRLLVRQMACDLFAVSVDPYVLRSDELRLLSVGAVAPRIVLREEDVNAWLRARSDPLTGRLRFRNGEIRADVRRRDSQTAELVVVPRTVGGNNLGFEFRSLRIAGIPLPVFPLSLLSSQYNPILKEMPCRFRIATVRCENGTFEIEN